MTDLKNANSRKIDIVILFLFSLVLHRGYFYPGFMTRDDWAFHYKEQLTEWFSPPYAWRAESSLSTMKLGWFTKYPIFVTCGFFAKFFYLDFNIIERILFFFPLVILPTLSMYYLTYHLFERRMVCFFSTILYSSNTVILLWSIGWVPLAIAFSFIPLILALLIQSLRETSLKKAFLTSIIFAISMAYESRITYMTAWILILYFLYVNIVERNFSTFINSLKVFVLFTITTIGLQAYWILPYFFGGGGATFASIIPSMPRQGQVQLMHAMILQHPFYTITGEIQWFAVQPVNPIFFLIPIIAFSAILLRKKEKNVVFFSVLALIGIFLCKGIKPPFGYVYTWLFMYFPGFNVYRGSIKLFPLVALSYSILFGVAISELSNKIKEIFKDHKILERIKGPGLHHLTRQKNPERISASFLAFILIAQIIMAWPAIGQQMNGNFYPSVKEPPDDYLKIKEFIMDQPPGFKTLWLPRWTRFSFYSDEYPVVPFNSKIYETFSELDTTIISNLNCSPSMSKSYVARLLALWNIKYVILSPDTGELDPLLYSNPQEKYVEFLEKQENLRRVDVGEEIYVYENMLHMSSKFFIHDDEINDFHRGELLKTSSFEKDTENWSIDWSVNVPIRQMMFQSNISYQGEHSLGIELYSKTRGWGVIRSPLIPVSYGNQYEWQFYIKGENAHDIHINVLTYNSKEEITNSYYKGDVGTRSFDWKKSVVSFTPTSPDVGYIQLEIRHGHQTDKPLPNRIWIDAVTFKLTDSSKEKDRILKNIFSSKEQPATVIEHKRIAPTKYIVRINAEKPFMVTFPETYDPKWIAMVNGKEYISVPCFRLNGFFIEQTGYLEIVIEYKPQVWFNYGSMVSIATLSSIIGLSLIWWREKREKIYRGAYRRIEREQSSVVYKRLKRNPSSTPILISIISLIVSAVISMVDTNLVNGILIYTFFLLVFGVLWKLGILVIEGEDEELYMPI